MKHFEIQLESELDAIAKELLALRRADINLFALYGKMGSGKTALVKAFCRVLKCAEPAVSPTFAIVNEYLAESEKKIYHFDFYRIESTEEAFDLGYEEYFFDEKALIFVEWPEMIEELLPEKHIKIHIIETADQMRQIEAERIEAEH